MPISLTSIVCKTLEHVIHSSIISCETQLILTIDDLARGLKDKHQIDAVLLDFSKAFDRVPQQRLLLKLKHYRVRENSLSWIEDFLSARTQEIIIEGSKLSSLYSQSSAYKLWNYDIPSLIWSINVSNMYRQNAHNMSYMIINDQHKLLAWDPTNKSTMVATPARWLEVLSALQ